MRGLPTSGSRTRRRCSSDARPSSPRAWHHAQRNGKEYSVCTCERNTHRGRPRAIAVEQHHQVGANRLSVLKGTIRGFGRSHRGDGSRDLGRLWRATRRSDRRANCPRLKHGTQELHRSEWNLSHTVCSRRQPAQLRNQCLHPEHALGRQKSLWVHTVEPYRHQGRTHVDVSGLGLFTRKKMDEEL